MSKVIFKDVRKIIEVILPSFPDSKILLYEGLLFGQVNELDNDKLNQVEKGVLSLKYLIKEWNFTDKDGKELPITIETLNQFPAEDLAFLLEKVHAFFTKEKKGKKKSSKI